MFEIEESMWTSLVNYILSSATKLIACMRAQWWAFFADTGGWQK